MLKLKNTVTKNTFDFLFHRLDMVEEKKIFLLEDMPIELSKNKRAQRPKENKTKQNKHTHKKTTKNQNIQALWNKYEKCNPICL